MRHCPPAPYFTSDDFTETAFSGSHRWFRTSFIGDVKLIDYLSYFPKIIQTGRGYAKIRQLWKNT